MKFAGVCLFFVRLLGAFSAGFPLHKYYKQILGITAMRRKEIVKYAVVNSLATALYIIIIASFMYLGSKGVFGTRQTILAPIAMLMLFVFSAALTGSLILGRPVLWYLGNKKHEALLLFAYTLGIFFAMTVVVFFVLIALAV